MALSYTGKPHADFFSIGNLKIPSSTRSGILSGSLSLICFLLVFTDYKKGFKIALGIIFISIGNLLFGMIMRHSIVSLPGMVTHTVSLITLVTLYSFYARLSISNMTDYITSMGNRRSYVKEISEHIEARKSFTLACVELEDFKHINDVY
jgi:predicted signal transduction protein with EAL and GGDEF domain